MDEYQNKLAELVSKLRKDARQISNIEYKAMVNFTNKIVEKYIDEPMLAYNELKRYQY